MSSDERPARPVSPAPAEPAAAEPAATGPTPAEPATTGPAPAEPATTGPAPAEPAAGEHAPAEPAPAGPAPAPDGPAPVPDAATLEAVATPARRRRAPRIGAFITTGVLVGVVVGWLLAVLASGTSGEARTGAILLTAGGLGALGAIVGSGLAALADRRSMSRRSRSRR